MLKIDDYKKLAKDKKVICNWVCAVLMLALLVMQFLPFWTFEVEIPVMRTEIVQPVEEPAEEVKEGEEATAEEATAEEATEEEATAEETTEEEATEEEAPVEEPAEPETVEVLDHMKKENRSVSINDYVWMPFNHEACDVDGISDPANGKVGMSGLENFLNSKLDEPVEIEKVLRMPIAYLIIAILGLLIAISSPKKLGVPVFAIIGGVVALFGYLTDPVFALGSAWIAHVVVSALLIVAGLGTIIFRIVKKESKEA